MDPRFAALPDDETLAAIPAAFVALQRARTPAGGTAPASRWRLAARLGALDPAEARAFGAVSSRWRAAGRRS